MSDNKENKLVQQQATCKTVILPKVKKPVWVIQEPYVDDTGIWLHCHAYSREGISSDYKLLVSKELFVEAYNKWIKEN
jgi:hypothetical protein